MQGVATTPATPPASNIAGTDKEKMDEEKIEIESGAGETSSAKVETSKDKENDNIESITVDIDKVEDKNKGLSKEDMEQLEKVISDAFRESYLERDEKLSRMLSKEDIKKIILEDDDNNRENDENDNLEGAKQWALSQKQNFK